MSNQPTPDDTKAVHLERLDPSERNDHQGAQHWARYEWACQFLPARRVLDCSCGLGYGSALLRTRGAQRVVGVDISPEAVAQAKQRYGGAGIEYVQADAMTLVSRDIGTFDLIVSLETIEHLAEPRKLLDVFRSLLAPGGVLALSCPNDAELGVENPYHLWRAHLGEVKSWLDERFAHVECYGEAHTLGVAAWPTEEMESRSDPLKRYSLTVRLVGTLPLTSSPGFLFACGDRPRAAAAPVAAELLNGHGYLRELERVRDRLWNEAQQLRSEAQNLVDRWETQHARIQELEQEKNRMWQEARRVGEAWEQQNTRIQELEAEKDRIWQEAQRLGQAWETQNAHIQQLEAAIKPWEVELTRLREAIAQMQQGRAFRILRRLGLLNTIDL